MNRLLLFILLMGFAVNLSAQEELRRMVLFEEFTGAWCGWCPRGNLILEELVRDYDRVIPVAIHSGPGFDPMRTDEGDQLTEELLVWYPTAAIDRFRFADYPTPPIPDADWEEKLQERLSLSPEAEVILDHQFNSESRQATLTVNVRFLKASKGNFSINAYIVENEVSGNDWYDQKNYYNEDPEYPDLYQRGNPISGYIHRHVLRDMLGGRYGINPEGEQHIPQSVSQGDTFTCDFEAAIDEAWDVTHLTLVAYVLRQDDSGDAEILNAVSQPMLSTSNVSIRKEVGLKVYPNPSRGTLFLDASRAMDGPDSYRVLDLSGRVIQQGALQQSLSASRYQLDLSTLSSGIYVLQVGYFRQKLYIQEL